MLIWRGYYIGPDGSMHPDDDGPVFTRRGGDEESRCVTAEEACDDADNACFLARIAGIAVGTVLFLDIDEDCSANYFTAWVATVRARGFTPGVTSSPAAVVLLGQRGIDLGMWVFRAIYLEQDNPAGKGVEQWVH
ncbi:MAG: hypothetical protein ABI467_23120 [Kofleriaceae bacterium]